MFSTAAVPSSAFILLGPRQPTAWSRATRRNQVVDRIERPGFLPSRTMLRGTRRNRTQSRRRKHDHIPPPRRWPLPPDSLVDSGCHEQQQAKRSGMAPRPARARQCARRLRHDRVRKVTSRSARPGGGSRRRGVAEGTRHAGRSQPLRARDWCRRRRTYSASTARQAKAPPVPVWPKAVMLTPSGADLGSLWSTIAHAQALGHPAMSAPPPPSWLARSTASGLQIARAVSISPVPSQHGVEISASPRHCHKSRRTRHLVRGSSGRNWNGPWSAPSGTYRRAASISSAAMLEEAVLRVPCACRVGRAPCVIPDGMVRPERLRDVLAPGKCGSCPGWRGTPVLQDEPDLIELSAQFGARPGRFPCCSSTRMRPASRTRSRAARGR